MTKLKNLKKATNEIVTYIRNSIPVSRRLFVRQNMAMVVVLESHKEFQMLNRQDIMMLAKQTMSKQLTENAEQKKTKPTSSNNEDCMYG